MSTLRTVGIWGAAITLCATGTAWAGHNSEATTSDSSARLVSVEGNAGASFAIHVKQTMKGGTADEIKATVSDAIKHARQAVNAGEKGDADGLVDNVRTALSKAKDAQRVGHNEYLNEGVYELGEAIEHGRKKQTEDATEHVRHAIMRLSQAADIQLPQ